MNEEETAATRRILLNEEVIAIDQDPLGICACRIVNATDHQVFLRPLADNRYALAIVNTTEAALTLRLDFPQLGLDGRYTLRDVWQHNDVRRKARNWQGTLSPHETRLFILQPSK